MLMSCAPIFYILMVWWISTGVILYLGRQPRALHAGFMWAASAVTLAALWGVAVTCNDTSTVGLYAAFTCSILVWGWQEMAFLMGFITGPSRAPCPPNLVGMRRFIAASRAVIHHELALVGSLAVIAGLTWQGTNQVALWTFLVLWIMRLSAKLNLFFGVRNRSEDFLPDHLRYLNSFFKDAAVNPFFPFALALACIAAVLGCLEISNALPNTPRALGMTFVVTLLSLAILEHLFMVLPISLSGLWSWLVRRGTAEA
jgi:putative photosynthetic complex assembly protein 2